ncbi:Molybdenum cofactor sulfurase [Acipenser ruthenus]|uniref:Molybdenum cofactor sulfurase n=1 Tax=Acipenser ruthenus TaxID=7906 RepID=A0A444UMV8_ACIRT|nr:Molybdenum cofactor sulfurase [Acipenser ruthenus]
MKYPLRWIHQIQTRKLYPSHGTAGRWFLLLDVGCSPLDLQAYPADFVPISIYKIFGFPTGLGALLVHNDSSGILEVEQQLLTWLEKTYCPRNVHIEQICYRSLCVLVLVELKGCRRVSVSLTGAASAVLAGGTPEAAVGQYSPAVASNKGAVGTVDQSGNQGRGTKAAVEGASRPRVFLKFMWCLYSDVGATYNARNPGKSCDFVEIHTIVLLHVVIQKVAEMSNRST